MATKKPAETEAPETTEAPATAPEPATPAEATTSADQAPKGGRKRTRVLTPCLCGCGKEVGSKFAPGHDARHASNLVTAWELGERNREDVMEAAAEISEAFQRKVRHGIENREAKRATRAAKANPAPAEATE